MIKAALKVIPAERLVVSSDCGMGREGMSRRHAFYKMVALVQGTNLVKKELGLPTESLARPLPPRLARDRSVRFRRTSRSFSDQRKSASGGGGRRSSNRCRARATRSGSCPPRRARRPTTTSPSRKSRS